MANWASPSASWGGGGSKSTAGPSVFAGTAAGGNQWQAGPAMNAGTPYTGGAVPFGMVLSSSPFGGMALYGQPNGGRPMGTWAGDHSFAFPGPLKLALPGQQGTSYDGSPAMYAPGQTVAPGEHWIPGEQDLAAGAPQAPATTSLRTTALRRLAQGQRLNTPY